MTLDYDYSYMFRPNYRAIFRLVFEQAECTIDHVFKALSIVHSACSKISLKMALQLGRICSWNYNLIKSNKI